MAKKTDLEQVRFTMETCGADPVLVNKVIADLETAIEQENADKEAEKAVKVSKTHYIIANTSNATGKVTDTPAMLIKANEDIAWSSVVDAIKLAGNDANQNEKKFKKRPMKTVFEIIGACPAKVLKRYGVAKVHKEVVMVLETYNTFDATSLKHIAGNDE